MITPPARRRHVARPAIASLAAGPAASLVARLAIASLAAALLAACSSSPPGENPPENRAIGANASDLQAISRLHQEFAAAHNEGDVDRLMLLFTDDAVLMPMDEPSLTGKTAIQEHYQNFFDQNPSTIELSPVETRVASDWAYERIELKVHLRGGESQERHTDIKYLWILQKQADGSWKISRASYNLDGDIDEADGSMA